MNASPLCLPEADFIDPMLPDLDPTTAENNLVSALAFPG